MFHIKSNPFFSFFVALLALNTANLHSAEISSELGVEIRHFPNKDQSRQPFLQLPRVPEFDNNANETSSHASLTGKIKFSRNWDNNNQAFIVTVFGRIDRDKERNHADIRELFWRKTIAKARIDLYLGARKVFWGVTESKHLVDIINQTDFIENVDGEQKLGQPMMQLVIERDWGTSSLFLLPYFRERTYPGEKGRFKLVAPLNQASANLPPSLQQLSATTNSILNVLPPGTLDLILDNIPPAILNTIVDNLPPTLSLAASAAIVSRLLEYKLVIDTKDTHYESGAKKKHLDFAARWSHYIGDLDIGLSYFQGTDRSPIPILLLENNQLSIGLLYPQLKQVGIDTQFTKEGLLLKLEAINRQAHDGGSEALVSGLEYTFVGVFNTAIDLGVIAEYQYDNRKTINPNDNDLVIGARIAFNDVQSSALLLLASIDDTNNTKFFSLEAQRRLGEKWSSSLQARFFSNVDTEDPSTIFENDDYIELQLTRYFD